MTKHCKIHSWKRQNFWSKFQFFFPRPPRKTSKIKEKPLALKREHPCTSKHEISSLFPLFLGHFCPPGSGPVDQNQCGSRSTTLLLKMLFRWSDCCSSLPRPATTWFRQTLSNPSSGLYRSSSSSRVLDPYGIHLIRIRIQGFYMTKNWKKFTAEKFFFGSKTTIYISLGFFKGRTSYKRNLQLSKENIQHLKPWNFLIFFYFCRSFLPSSIRIRIRIPNTDPDRLAWSGSETLSCMTSYGCPVKYSDLNNLMVVTGKLLPYIILSNAY